MRGGAGVGRIYPAKPPAPGDVDGIIPSSASPASSAAEAIIAAWGSEMLDVDPRALSVADLDECDAVNAALAAPAAASRLGGHVGFKMGWKGAFAKRASLFGPLFGVGMIRSGASVSLSAHKIFCAEAEFGFVFDKKLEARATAYSEEEVWGAVRSVELCVELCGARQHASASKLDYVADALCSACVVRGPTIDRPRDPSVLTTVAVRLLVAGIEVARGDARCNPLDSPLASLTFLANDLCVRLRRPLDAGALVISGHCCQTAFDRRPAPPFVALPSAAWIAGDHVRAIFDGLGTCDAVLLE